jgi:Domain of unknown function (DUF5655)/Domain of unknown function (DUF4287)
MATVEEGLKSQIRNIETKHGRSMEQWGALLSERGLSRHGQMMPVLKNEFGISHGNANRIALEVLARAGGGARPVPAADPAEQLYGGRKAALRPVHERLMAAVQGLGDDVEVAPKKAYLSLRRRKQFALIQPAAAHVDVGLILPGEAAAGRLEPSGNFNAMFTHRVRVATPEGVDGELSGWLRKAYEAAR